MFKERALTLSGLAFCLVTVGFVIQLLFLLMSFVILGLLFYNDD